VPTRKSPTPTPTYDRRSHRHGRGKRHRTRDSRSVPERYDLVAGIDIDDAIHEVATEFDDVAGYVADVRDHERVHEIVDDVEGRADVVAVVNNAAISHYKWIGDLGPEEWREYWT